MWLDGEISVTLTIIQMGSFLPQNPANGVGDSRPDEVVHSGEEVGNFEVDITNDAADLILMMLMLVNDAVADAGADSYSDSDADTDAIKFSTKLGTQSLEHICCVLLWRTTTSKKKRKEITTNASEATAAVAAKSQIKTTKTRATTK